MRLLTFPRGGVHPRDNKSHARSAPIQKAAIPSLSTVPLQQHLGAPAERIVEPGDEVREGMEIAKSGGFVSAPIHAPIPGVVKEIRSLFLPNGVSTDAVVIELSGEFDRSGKEQPIREVDELSSQDLLKIVAQMGIVGLGGATFPTHVKLSVPKGTTIDSFLINGVECEPYLCADHRLMLEKSEEIIKGIEIVARILKPERIVLGIEENKPDAVRAMTEVVHKSSFPISINTLAVKYPQGDEKQLIKALLGREVPSGGLPLDVGTIVSNVGTVLAIYEAVVLDKPLIERSLTVAGGAIENPANLKVRIGTPVSQLIEECGGFKEKPAKVIMGGPMMGFTLLDLDTPVTKGTSGILAMTQREARSSTRTPCLGCGRCIQVCPLGLNPTQIFKLVDHLEYEAAVKRGLMDCKECGCCGYTCPANIPLIQGMKLGKRIYINQQRSRA